MKKLLIACVAALALAFTVSASAALVPGVFDPGNTGCVKATFNKKTKTLHLEKNCPTGTNAAAGADLTGSPVRRSCPRRSRWRARLSARVGRHGSTWRR